MSDLVISTDRRSAPRVTYDLWVKEITNESERIIRCINLSSSGMKLLANPLAKKSKLLIRLGSDIYNVDAEFVRSEENAFAVKFINPSNEIISALESLAM